MAKAVEVTLKEGGEWIEVEVANFYDPEKHHTVRVKGSTEKLKYAAMRLPDGQIYDKINDRWKKIEPSTPKVFYQELPKMPLDFADNSVKEIYLDYCLQYSEDPLTVIRECQRVLIPGGKLKLTVPMAPSRYAFSDMAYKSYFNELTFETFLEGSKYGGFVQYQYQMSEPSLSVMLRK